jgi:pimeloyl-ACP methyl ester carboxylesterase
MRDVIEINNRKIGIREYGDKNGSPIFYSHGYPGSRLDGELLDFDQQAKSANVRIIALDRPGIGLSDYKPERKLLDYSADIQSVADELSIETFSVVGFSGGGPYALACAFSSPHRIRSVGFVSGMGPFEYEESRKDNAMFIPRRMQLIRRVIANVLYKQTRRNADMIVKNQIRVLPKVDARYLSTQARKQTMASLFREHFRQGVYGFLQETEIYRQPWGFSLSDIKPRVHLWHGTADRNVAVNTGRRMMRDIPNCSGNIIDHEGHFSLIGKYFKDILGQVR